MNNDVQPDISIDDVIHAAWRGQDCRDWLPMPLGGWLICQLLTPSRKQGWKLHISADVSCAIEVLERCLPVLLAEKANF